MLTKTIFKVTFHKSISVDTKQGPLHNPAVVLCYVLFEKALLISLDAVIDLLFQLDQLATQLLLRYPLFLRLGMLLFLELLHLGFIHGRDEFSTSKHRVILLIFFHSESLTVTDLAQMF